jgi:hypothetical protein
MHRHYGDGWTPSGSCVVVDVVTIAELFTHRTGTGDVSSRGFTPEEALAVCGPRLLPVPGAATPQESENRDALCRHRTPVMPSLLPTDRTTDNAGYSAGLTWVLTESKCPL